MSSSSRGAPSRPGRWGDLPLVVDTSAWARAHLPPVREPWQQALLDDRLRLSPAARLEILYAARDGAAFETLADGLSALRRAPLTSSVVNTAEATMRALARRSAGAHRVPPIDYLVAAAAHELGGAVIHYDRDYDLLAEVLPFESVWLAPPGSLL
jgi:predicted nucleic acid-binding protein